MSGYDRKKYIAKLMYIFLLGYDVDFGHLEALKLLADVKFSRKQMGYLFLSLFLHESHEMVPLVIQSFLEDLKSSNEFYQSMALHAAGSIAGRDIAEALMPSVEQLAKSQSTPLAVRKKALAVLVTLFRKRPDCIALEQWPEHLLQLLGAKSLGLVSSTLTLLLEFAGHSPEVFEICQTGAISVLQRMQEGKYHMDYNYYGVPAPWAQITLMRYLMLYPPSKNLKADDGLHDIMARILATPSAVKDAKERTINHKNTRNCVLFETIRLTIHYDTSDKLLSQTINLLGQMLKARQPNIRYLGLESMSRLVASRDVQRLVREHQQTVVDALRDSDVSIRKRALDLLYSMCDAESAKVIVRQLLDYLVKAEFEVREELATKTAMLAERFSSNKAWYIDVMLDLLRIAGEDVPDDIWHRVIRVVLSCSEDVQAYAARTCLRALKDPHWNEILLKVGAYVLGEFGTLISEEPGSHPEAQFEALHSLWPMVSNVARAVLLNTYAKFAFLFGADRNLVSRIEAIMNFYAASLDEEIQQRASEYSKLIRLDPAIVEKVWDPMPAWEEDDMAPADEGQASLIMQGSAATASSQQDGSLLGDYMQAQAQQQYGGMVPSTPPPALPMAPVSSGASGILGVEEPTPMEAEQHDTFYRQLWQSPEGFLFRDPRLQIGVKSQLQQGVYHLMLYFGNTSGADIQDFVVATPSVDYLQIVAKPVSPSIPAGAQASQLLSMGALKEFVPSPVMQINYRCNGRAFHIPLKLPVILTKYVVPDALDSSGFFAKWKLCETPGMESQSIVKGNVKTVGVQHVSDILRRYGFAVLSGVDPNPNNCTGAGAFVTATMQVTPVLVRVEGNSQALMARLTVRSTNATVSSTIARFITVQIEVPN